MHISWLSCYEDVSVCHKAEGLRRKKNMKSLFWIHGLGQYQIHRLKAKQLMNRVTNVQENKNNALWSLLTCAAGFSKYAAHHSSITRVVYVQKISCLFSILTHLANVPRHVTQGPLCALSGCRGSRGGTSRSNIMNITREVL